MKEMSIYPIVVFLIVEVALAVFLLVSLYWEEAESIPGSTTFLKPSKHEDLQVDSN
jgi:hypothetical protein